MCPAQQWEGDLSASASNRSPDQMEEKLPGASQLTKESRCPENGSVLRLRSSLLGLPRGCVAACDPSVPLIQQGSGQYNPTWMLLASCTLCRVLCDLTVTTTTTTKAIKIIIGRAKTATPTKRCCKDFSSKGLSGLMGWVGTSLPKMQVERVIVN